MPETAVSLRVTDLAKSYGAAPVLAGATLEIAAGGCVAVLGPSGSGKTTLLRIVAGLVTADRGTVEVAGRLTDAPEPRVRAEARGVAFLFQDLALWPHMTIRGNLDFVLEARGVARGDRERLAGESAAAAEFPAALLGRRPGEISGGERQRAALARVLAQEPKLLLLDEPLSHLDPALRASLLLQLRRLRRERSLASLLVTHDMAEAFALADVVVVLHHGRMEQTGAPRDVYERPRTRFVAEFVGRASFLPATRRDGRLVTAAGEFPADGAPDGAVVAVLRPERVRPADGAPVRARVADAVFQGDHWLWAVDLASGGGSEGARVLVRADRNAARGEEVALVVDPPPFVPAEEGVR